MDQKSIRKKISFGGFGSGFGFGFGGGGGESSSGLRTSNLKVAVKGPGFEWGGGGGGGGKEGKEEEEKTVEQVKVSRLNTHVTARILVLQKFQIEGGFILLIFLNILIGL
jgi:hypothetical protein